MLAVVSIIISGCVSLAVGFVLWHVKRKDESKDKQEQRISDLEERMTAQETHCENCKKTQLTEERLKEILEEAIRNALNQRELDWVNEGRLLPRYQKHD